MPRWAVPKTDLVTKAWVAGTHAERNERETDTKSVFPQHTSVEKWGELGMTVPPRNTSFYFPVCVLDLLLTWDRPLRWPGAAVYKSKERERETRPCQNKR